MPKICMVGSCNVDLIARVARLPGPGETILGSKFQIGFGGKGANQAVMAAKLGAQVSVIGRVGSDIFGRDTAQNFHSVGIDTTYLGVDDTLFSGVAPIQVDENTGQNSIIIVPGANYGFFAKDVRAAAPAIQSADVLICQLEILMECTLEAFRIAKETTGKKVITMLNPAPAAALPDELLRLTDIIIPNEVEAAMLTDIATDTPEGVEAAARALQAKGVATVIITLGKRGAMFIEGSNAPEFVAAQEVKAVDTTGAGDSFVGSLAYCLGDQRPLREAVKKASQIATRSVLRHGTQTSFPNRDEVLDIIGA
jgi:ribokinase